MNDFGGWLPIGGQTVLIAPPVPTISTVVLTDESFVDGGLLLLHSQHLLHFFRGLNHQSP
jgi:hypothetical protein